VRKRLSNRALAEEQSEFSHAHTSIVLNEWMDAHTHFVIVRREIWNDPSSWFTRRWRLGDNPHKARGEQYETDRDASSDRHSAALENTKISGRSC
jgi:hypothetical protein